MLPWILTRSDKFNIRLSNSSLHASGSFQAMKDTYLKEAVIRKLRDLVVVAHTFNHRTLEDTEVFLWVGGQPRLKGYTKKAYLGSVGVCMKELSLE